MADPDDTRAAWDATPLRAAVALIEPQLRLAAEDGGLVVAVTDPGARILWTCEGSGMRRRAHGVNFVPGGRWDESSVGTNALDLALRIDAPATGRQLGVLDLSTTWDRSHPMGTATAVAFARLLEQALPAPAAPQRPGGLELRLLGRAQARLDGVRLLLTHRQLEILAVLTLYPDGLSLDALHAHLYGDRRVSRATLKAEVSHLRTMLGGAIAVRCDAADVLEHLRAGRLLDAVSAYRGDLLAGTDAPALTEYGNYLAVAVREALLAAPEPEAVLRYARAVPYDIEVLEHALRALRGTSHAAAPLLRARLRAANNG